MIEYKKRYCIEFEINQIALNDTKRQEKINEIHRDYYTMSNEVLNDVYSLYKEWEEEDKKCREVK